MTFCGKETKYKKGETIKYIGNEYIIEDEGIIGGKLGPWYFVYFCRDKNGGMVEIIENENIEKVK